MEVMAQAGVYSYDFGNNFDKPFQHQMGIAFKVIILLNWVSS
jgi:hypothetical protein